MITARVSFTALGLVLFIAACGDSLSPGTDRQVSSTTGGGDTTGNGSTTQGGTTGANATGGAGSGTTTTSGTVGTNGTSDTTTGTTGGGADTTGTGGTTGNASTTQGGTTGSGVTTSGPTTGSVTTGSGVTTGSVTTGSGVTTSGATTGTSGRTTGSTSTTTSTGTTGTSTTGTTGSAMVQPKLVTSAPGAYWKTDGAWTEVTTAATITVNDTTVGQTWEGFGGAFNELGWTVLTTQALKDQAVQLLFGTNGAHFAWGRIPMGASDYATSRYTNDDTGTDVAANSAGSNRPPADTAMAMFSITRDGQNLIPYIKAAQAVRSDLRFWASPWTPPVWMKTGYDTTAGGSGTAKKPSYYDGGTMVNSAANLMAYAQYYTKFVQGYKAQNINIEIVSPQNEPGYEQNYPSCLWDKATYTAWVGQYLGPAMKTLGVKVMLGTLSNSGDANRTDLDISTAVLADATAKSFLSVVGVQWGVLDKVTSGTTFSGLPIWATEHKCGNYPWAAGYNSTQAPNDQAYGVESWGYIRDAITKGKVTSYSAWNMVLDKIGLGNDTSRDWKQDALLSVSGGVITQTPAYYVFRHFSQFVQVGAKVVGTTGGDAVAFKNPDNSIVVVLYNSGATTNIVAVGGKKLSFPTTGAGWSTVYYAP